MADHLWYLSEKLVGLAFFDSNVANEVKDRVMAAMSVVEGEDDPPKRIKLNEVTLAALRNKQVSDFVTTNIRSLIIKLNLKSGFLQLPASQLMDCEEYKAAASTIRKLASGTRCRTS
mgnify:CR=1 FL=1